MVGKDICRLAVKKKFETIRKISTLTRFNNIEQLSDFFLRCNNGIVDIYESS